MMMKTRVMGPALGLAILFVLPDGAAVAGDRAPSQLATCISCHGAHGEGSSSGVPRLAGQNAEYLSHALSMFKAGTRASAIMQPVATTLAEDEMEALAAYFSKQSAPPVDASASAAVSAQLAKAGELLARSGASACFSCHGMGGKGNGSRYPSIAGQPARFVVDRIHEFQERARQKAPQPGTMTAVSITLSEQQIQESAAYLSRLPR
jgi:cytochrome c553